jgi:methyl-accepting chemotaxis protein
VITVREATAAALATAAPIVVGAIGSNAGAGVGAGVIAGAGVLALVAERTATARSQATTTTEAVAVAASARIEAFEAGLRLERAQLETATAELRATFDRERETTATSSREAVGRATSAAERARENAGSALDAARGVGEAVGRVAASIAAVTDAERRGEEMVRVSETVDAFSATLAELADQANLVSLNATIEVARSGRRDSSVAVFADELRSLAERMRERGREVTAIAERLREHARSVTGTMSQSRASLAAGEAALTGAGDGLRAVVQATGENVAFLEQVAASAGDGGSVGASIERVERAAAALLAALQSTAATSSRADSSSR